MEIELDLNRLTVGDVEDIEDICGKPLDELDFRHPNGKLIKAIVYIIARRGDPSFTLDDARKIELSEIRLKEPETANPTAEGGLVSG